MSATFHTYREATASARFVLRELTNDPISVLDRNRKPLGYVDVANLKDSEADPVCCDPLSLIFHIDRIQHDPVSEHMTKFKRTSSHPYTLITVSTPLAELEEFLKTNIFALGASHA
jgi:hypothetical protein